jgi:hypothetical protein
MQGAIRIDLSAATPDDNLATDNLGGNRACIPASGAGESPDTVEISVILLRPGRRRFFHGRLRVMIPGKKCDPAVTGTGVGKAWPRHRSRGMARNKKQSAPQRGQPPHRNDVTHRVHLRKPSSKPIYLPRTNWIASDRGRGADATCIRDERGQRFPHALARWTAFPKIKTKPAS